MKPNTNALTVRHAHIVPSILANAGENAATKFLEFFAARIRNANTREPYARACSQFLSWKEQHVGARSELTSSGSHHYCTLGQKLIPANYGALNGSASHRINPKLITQNWDDFLRVAGSLKMGKLAD